MDLIIIFVYFVFIKFLLVRENSRIFLDCMKNRQNTVFYNESVLS